MPIVQREIHNIVQFTHLLTIRSVDEAHSAFKHIPKIFKIFLFNVKTDIFEDFKQNLTDNFPTIEQYTYSCIHKLNDFASFSHGFYMFSRWRDSIQLPAFWLTFFHSTKRLLFWNTNGFKISFINLINIIRYYLNWAIEYLITLNSLFITMNILTMISLRFGEKNIAWFVLKLSRKKILSKHLNRKVEVMYQQNKMNGFFQAFHWQQIKIKQFLDA